MSTGERTFNLADLFEQVVDRFPEREYLVVGDQRRTYAELEERANRLAHDLAEHGVEAGDHVGIYAHNSAEWVETLWAVFKIRAVWININYRYVEGELSYLFGNSDLKALVYEQGFGAPRRRLPGLAARPASTRSSSTTAPAPTSASWTPCPTRRLWPRRRPSGTSAPAPPTTTTSSTPAARPACPRASCWRQEDVFMALGGGIDPDHQDPGHEARGHARERAYDSPITFFPIAPLMHGATQWGVMGQALTGNRVVLVANFDPDECWDLIQREGINSMMITGDAMGRPLIEALDRTPGPLRRVVPVLAVQQRRRLLAVGEGPVLRGLPRPDPDRRHRLRRSPATTAWSSSARATPP